MDHLQWMGAVRMRAQTDFIVMFLSAVWTLILTAPVDDLRVSRCYSKFEMKIPKIILPLHIKCICCIKLNAFLSKYTSFSPSKHRLDLAAWILWWYALLKLYLSITCVRMCTHIRILNYHTNEEEMKGADLSRALRLRLHWSEYWCNVSSVHLLCNR